MSADQNDDASASLSAIEHDDATADVECPTISAADIRTIAFLAGNKDPRTVREILRGKGRAQTAREVFAVMRTLNIPIPREAE